MHFDCHALVLPLRLLRYPFFIVKFEGGVAVALQVRQGVGQVGVHCLPQRYYHQRSHGSSTPEHHRYRPRLFLQR